jgi:hypothetical protein
MAAADQNLIWANLLHLSFNMWEDRPDPAAESRYSRPDLRFDESLWTDLLEAMADSGLNMVVLDLGDGVRYESRPEIAVDGAWSVARLREEIERCRSLGLELIPKLNFSTAHDTWLAEYSRMVSTPVYYSACRDLIDEVISIFGTPRFFHLGYDEETAEHQRGYDYLVVRQHDLWWHDLFFFVDEVEQRSVRPWIWSDYYWHHPEAFLEEMPRSVLQSNWYYGTDFASTNPCVKTYADLDAAGFHQVPTGSNHSNPENFVMTVRYGAGSISPERLLGFLQTPWKPTLETQRDHHLAAIGQVRTAIRGLDSEGHDVK